MSSSAETIRSTQSNEKTDPQYLGALLQQKADQNHQAALKALGFLKDAIRALGQGASAQSVSQILEGVAGFKQVLKDRGMLAPDQVGSLREVATEIASKAEWLLQADPDIASCQQMLETYMDRGLAMVEEMYERQIANANEKVAAMQQDVEETEFVQATVADGDINTLIGGDQAVEVTSTADIVAQRKAFDAILWQVIKSGENIDPAKVTAQCQIALMKRGQVISSAVVSRYLQTKWQGITNIEHHVAANFAEFAGKKTNDKSQQEVAKAMVAEYLEQKPRLTRAAKKLYKPFAEHLAAKLRPQMEERRAKSQAKLIELTDAEAAEMTKEDLVNKMISRDVDEMIDTVKTQMGFEKSLQKMLVKQEEALLAETEQAKQQGTVSIRQKKMVDIQNALIEIADDIVDLTKKLNALQELKAEEKKASKGSLLSRLRQSKWAKVALVLGGVMAIGFVSARRAYGQDSATQGAPAIGNGASPDDAPALSSGATSDAAKNAAALKMGPPAPADTQAVLPAPLASAPEVVAATAPEVPADKAAACFTLEKAAVQPWAAGSGLTQAIEGKPCEFVPSPDTKASFALGSGYMRILPGANLSDGIKMADLRGLIRLKNTDGVITSTIVTFDENGYNKNLPADWVDADGQINSEIIEIHLGYCIDEGYIRVASVDLGKSANKEAAASPAPAEAAQGAPAVFGAGWDQITLDPANIDADTASTNPQATFSYSGNKIAVKLNDGAILNPDAPDFVKYSPGDIRVVVKKTDGTTLGANLDENWQTPDVNPADITETTIYYNNAGKMRRIAFSVSRSGEVRRDAAASPTEEKTADAASDSKIKLTDANSVGAEASASPAGKPAEAVTSAGAATPDAAVNTTPDTAPAVTSGATSAAPAAQPTDNNRATIEYPQEGLGAATTAPSQPRAAAPEAVSADAKTTTASTAPIEVAAVPVAPNTDLDQALNQANKATFGSTPAPAEKKPAAPTVAAATNANEVAASAAPVAQPRVISAEDSGNAGRGYIEYRPQGDGSGARITIDPVSAPAEVPATVEACTNLLKPPVNVPVNYDTGTFSIKLMENITGIKKINKLILNGLKIRAEMTLVDGSVQNIMIVPTVFMKNGLALPRENISFQELIDAGWYLIRTNADGDPINEDGEVIPYNGQFQQAISTVIPAGATVKATMLRTGYAYECITTGKQKIARQIARIDVPLEYPIKIDLAGTPPEPPEQPVQPEQPVVPEQPKQPEQPVQPPVVAAVPPVVPAPAPTGINLELEAFFGRQETLRPKGSSTRIDGFEDSIDFWGVGFSAERVEGDINSVIARYFSFDGDDMDGDLKVGQVQVGFKRDNFRAAIDATFPIGQNRRERSKWSQRQWTDGEDLHIETTLNKIMIELETRFRAVGEWEINKDGTATITLGVQRTRLFNRWLTGPLASLNFSSKNGKQGASIGFTPETGPEVQAGITFGDARIEGAINADGAGIVRVKGCGVYDALEVSYASEFGFEIYPFRLFDGKDSCKSPLQVGVVEVELPNPRIYTSKTRITQQEIIKDDEPGDGTPTGIVDDDGAPPDGISEDVPPADEWADPTNNEDNEGVGIPPEQNDGDYIPPVDNGPDGQVEDPFGSIRAAAAVRGQEAMTAAANLESSMSGLNGIAGNIGFTDLITGFNPTTGAINIIGAVGPLRNDVNQEQIADVVEKANMAAVAIVQYLYQLEKMGVDTNQFISQIIKPEYKIFTDDRTRLFVTKFLGVAQRTTGRFTNEAAVNELIGRLKGAVNTEAISNLHEPQNMTPQRAWAMVQLSEQGMSYEPEIINLARAIVIVEYNRQGGDLQQKLQAATTPEQIAAAQQEMSEHNNRYGEIAAIENALEAAGINPEQLQRDLASRRIGVRMNDSYTRAGAMRDLVGLMTPRR